MECRTDDGAPAEEHLVYDQCHGVGVGVGLGLAAAHHPGVVTAHGRGGGGPRQAAGGQGAEAIPEGDVLLLTEPIKSVHGKMLRRTLLTTKAVVTRRVKSLSIFSYAFSDACA